MWCRGVVHNHVNNKITVLVLGVWDKNTMVRAGAMPSPGFSYHYLDLGIKKFQALQKKEFCQLKLQLQHIIISVTKWTDCDFSHVTGAPVPQHGRQRRQRQV